ATHDSAHHAVLNNAQWFICHLAIMLTPDLNDFRGEFLLLTSESCPFRFAERIGGFEPALGFDPWPDHTNPRPFPDKQFFGLFANASVADRKSFGLERYLRHPRNPWDVANLDELLSSIRRESACLAERVEERPPSDGDDPEDDRCIISLGNKT